MKQARSRIFLTSLGSSLKTAPNGWTNYLCPICKDGKKEHFWVSPDRRAAYCHKCSRSYSIESSGDAVLSNSISGGLMGLRSTLKAALTNLCKQPVSKEKETMKKSFNSALVYSPLDLPKLARDYEAFEVWEIKGHVKSVIEGYCAKHHIYPLNIASVFGKVLTPKTAM